MAEHYRRDPAEVSPREPVQEDAIADGDAALDREPPNVVEAEPAPGTDDDYDADDDADDSPGGGGRGVESLRRDLAAAGERYLRLAAEFDNYRKRSERERAESWGRAQGDLAGRLLDALDDLERVRQHAAGATVESLVEGVQMVERKLRNALAAAGLETVEAEGAPFDPNSMEAVAMVGTDSRDEDDVVSDVFQRGYTFKGTLLRPARVRVKKHGA
jgi:molecular chaperone GrpE